jgi:hypothetical protein
MSLRSVLLLTQSTHLDKVAYTHPRSLHSPLVTEREQAMTSSDQPLANVKSQQAVPIAASKRRAMI